MIAVDTEMAHSGRQSLRIKLPASNEQPVHVIAGGKLHQFRAGNGYRLDAFVRISDARAIEGDVGIWVGDELVCKLSPQDADAAAQGWVSINGLYQPQVTNRDSVRVGVNNVADATVWFDDVKLRVAAKRTNALKLTMLGCPATEVIASEGQGLRPFQQPLLIVRRRAKSTAFASVFEPYYGRPAVQALRPLSPNSAGVEIVTDRTIDRFLVSDRRETCGSLSVEGMIGAVSLDRATGVLRWLCVGNGAHVSTEDWSLATTAPATLYLERGKEGYVLRSWGEGASRVTIQGPGVTGQLEVHELSALGERERKIDVAAPARGLSFTIRGGKAYALVEPGSTK